MKYRLCEEKLKDGGNTFTAYGIVLPNGERVDGITFDKKAAERIIRQLNENSVSVAHALDVIEDFLFESTTLEIKHYGE